MARGGSKRTKPEALQKALREVPGDRPGLPAQDSIESVEPFVSPQNDEYKILHTTEVDAYDKPPKPKASPRRRKG